MYGVASGFADAFAMADVGFYLWGGDLPHSHPGDGVAHGEVVVPNDGYAGVDLVGLALEQFYEPPDVVTALCLSEDACQVDDGIGPKYHGVGAPRDGQGLALCVGADGLCGVV